MLALGYFTFRDLLHDRWRSLLTILSLAVVVVGYLLLVSLAQALGSLSRPAQVTNNLLILAADTIDPMDSSLQEDVLQTAVEIAPGQIRHAFPLLFRHLTIAGQLMQVRSVALEEMSTSVGLTLLQGDWPAGSRQVVVSEGAAGSASWKIGSTVNIYGTDFQVTGLIRTNEQAFGSVWMTYTEGQRLFGTSRGFQVGYLSLLPSADPASVRARLLADPRISPACSVYLENAFTNSYNQSNTNLLTLSGLMVLVSLLVVTFGIYNATSLSLTERSLEIGLLHVIGFTLSQTARFPAGTHPGAHPDRLQPRLADLAGLHQSPAPPCLCGPDFPGHPVDPRFQPARPGSRSHLCLSGRLAGVQAPHCAEPAARERLSMSAYLFILRLGLQELFSHRRLALIMSVSIAIATAMVAFLAAYRTGLAAEFTEQTSNLLVVHDNQNVGDIGGSRISTQVARNTFRAGNQPDHPRDPCSDRHFPPERHSPARHRPGAVYPPGKLHRSFRSPSGTRRPAPPGYGRCAPGRQAAPQGRR